MTGEPESMTVGLSHAPGRGRGPDEPAPAGDDLIVLIPVYEDWEAVGLLLSRLDEALRDHARGGDRPRPGTRVVLVDDGSNTPAPAALFRLTFRAVDRVSVLTLRRNLGHQRALAVGLSYVEANLPCRVVVVMDGDGEDRPADVPRLLDRFEQEGGRRIVFAERGKRSESLLFRAGYFVYKLLHLLLTGIRVRAGNFSVVPYPLLSRLVVVSDLWNHYPASVLKSRLPVAMHYTERGRRLVGRSKMNLVALVIHGLSGIAVFGDRVGVRMLAAVAGCIAAVLAGLAGVVAVKVGTDWAIPGWATSTTGLLLVMLFQLLMLMLVFTFIVLGHRDGSSFLPVRDHGYFVGQFREVFPADESLRVCG